LAKLESKYPVISAKMKVFKDIVTGDELFTDTYPVENVGGLYRVRGKHVTRSETFDDSKLGANPNAEEHNETADASSVSGINVVLDNRLTSTSFPDKKSFTVYFKTLVKSMEEHKKSQNADFDVTAWRTEVQTTFKNILANFKDYEFFLGESCNPDGNVALVRWEEPPGETDEVPYVYFFADGVKEVKC